MTRADDEDYPQQIANFARMGFVCLVLDMIGMVDNTQISHYYEKMDTTNHFSETDQTKELWLSGGCICENPPGLRRTTSNAARAVACALPLLEGVRSAKLGKAALALSGEQEYAEKCYIPGILAVGGLEGCLKLADRPVETF